MSSLVPGAALNTFEHRGGGELGAVRSLDGDVEGVLHHTRRQHVHDDLRRHRADADLWVLHRVALGVDEAAELDGQGQLAKLLLGQAEIAGAGVREFAG